MASAQQQAWAHGAPAPASGQWPPKWDTTGAQLAGDEPGTAKTRSLPSLEQLDYVNKAITTGLLLLGLPTIATLLVRNPKRTAGRLGRKHLA